MFSRWPSPTIASSRLRGRDVFFKYKKTGSERWRTMKLEAMEFLRRFLQHVLPTGFMKVRYYGFLSPSSSIDLDHIRQLIESACGIKAAEVSPEPETALHSLTCPACGGKLKYSHSVLPASDDPRGYRVIFRAPVVQKWLFLDSV